MKPVVRILILALCLLIFCTVFLNIEYGLWQDGFVRQKVELVGLFIGECNEQGILDDISATGTSDCLRPLGDYALIDFILIFMTGLISVLSANVLLGGGKSSHSRSRRRSWAFMLLGSCVAIFALLDLLGRSVPGQPGIAWDEIIGLPRILVDCILIISGVLVFRRGSQNHTQILDSNKRVLQRRLIDVDPDNLSIGQMRSALGLTILEDIFQLGSSDGIDDPGRVCHYCSGAGCSECGMAGML